MKNKLALYELDCGTRFRLRLRDTMAMAGADSWISVQTDAQRE